MRPQPTRDTPPSTTPPLPPHDGNSHRHDGNSHRVDNTPDPQQHQQSLHEDGMREIVDDGILPGQRRASQFDLALYKSVAPLWHTSAAFQLRVYLSDEPDFADVRHKKKCLVWREAGLRFGGGDGDGDGDGDATRAANRTVQVSAFQALHPSQNRTLYAHVLAVRDGYSPNPSSTRYDPEMVAYRRHELTRYMRRKPKAKTRSLLGGDDGDGGAIGFGWGDKSGDGLEDDGLEVAESDSALDAPADTEADAEGVGAGPPTLSYWKPRLWIYLVHDQTAFPAASLPAALREQMALVPGASRAGGAARYAPVLFVDELTMLTKDLRELNRSGVTNATGLPLSLSFGSMALWNWQLRSQMVASWQAQAAAGGAATERSHDDLRQMLLDTNPILLGVTAVVTLLHTVFDCLAFKNDVQFWRKMDKRKAGMEGLSVRALALNIFFQVVILLYLLDNDTSYTILFSSGLGLLIEAWKVSKAVAFVRQSPGDGDADGGCACCCGWRVVPRHRSAKANRTREYDAVAMAHLGLCMYPAVLGYALYSLTHSRHKSWYAWILSSLVGFVYAFGFVQQTPQLFINYKLKSVAHMPWRSMVYKALNTFIDDLFAFIIKMPTMHRLSCFRDDIVFFIYLYQRWIYKEDKSRRNEFGQVGEEKAVAGATTEQPTTTAAAAAAATTATTTATMTQQESPAAPQVARRRTKRDR